MQKVLNFLYNIQDRKQLNYFQKMEHKCIKFNLKNQ